MTLWMVGLALAAEPCTPDEEVSAELSTLSAQADAAGPSGPADARNQRIARVRELLDQVCTDEDAYHAARVLRTGEVDDIDTARPLAQRAHDAGVEGADWLNVLVEDRWHVHHGKPQPFGTSRSIEGQVHCIWEIDPSVTDEVRRSRSVKTMSDTYAATLARNGLADEEPTAESLAEHELFCSPIDTPSTRSSGASASSYTPPKRGGGGADTDLALGELYGTRYGWGGNAYTTEKGVFAMHLLMRSAVGVTDAVDLKVSLLGLIAGPNASVEVGLLQGDGPRVSIEAGGFVGWLGTAYEGGGVLHLSVPFGAGMINLNAAGGVATVATVVGNQIVVTSAPYARPEIGLDLFVGDRGAFVFSGRGDVLQLSTAGADVLAFNAMYAHTWDSFGMTIGTVVYRFDPLVIPDGFFGNLPTPPAGWFPTPQFQLWARF